MRLENILRDFCNAFQAGVLIYTIVRLYRRIRNSREAMPAAFFLFGCVSIFMSNLYWFTYDFLHPGTRMPFAANEFGESASYLLFSMALVSIFHGIIMPTMKETHLTIIFAAANVLLWIAWSGEWADDILAGICFGYFLCITVRSLKLSGVFTKGRWQILGLMSFGLILLQGLVLLVSEPAKQILDGFCYVWMYAGIVWFLIEIVSRYRNGCEADQMVAVAFAGYAWALVSLYMSAEPMYFAVDILVQVWILLILQTVLRRETT